MSWTRLIYGTAILAALSGTAIYYGGDRTVVRAIDIVELSEAVNERLMPFGYTLATNTLIYQQAKWIEDPRTNRWQSGSNMMPYLIFDGFTESTDTFVNVSGIAQQGQTDAYIPGEQYDGLWFFYNSGMSVPGKDDFIGESDQWKLGVVQTGLTTGVDWWIGITNDLPAYVFDVHPRGVGYINAKATLDTIDTALMAIIPSYVDHEKAMADGTFTNASIPMLSVSSVWTRLSLPSIWTNVTREGALSCTNWNDSWTNDAGTVTNVARIGTNAIWNVSTNISTNFAFTTGPICTTNMLTERYKVASYLRWTKGTTPGWTNVMQSTWTNSDPSTNISHPTDGHGLYTWDGYSYYPGTGATPDYPSWWESPLSGLSQSPLVDDSESGASVTNITGSRPYRYFSSSGQYYKAQIGGGRWFDGLSGWPDTILHGYGEWLFVFRQEFQSSRNDVLIKRTASPLVNVPYNIAACTVTGDVYFSTASTNRIRLYSETMTHTGAYSWVGTAFPMTNDIFTATNFPYTRSVNSDLWPWLTSYGLQYREYTESYGGQWNVQASTTITEKDVVFKWAFSRCHP